MRVSGYCDQCGVRLYCYESPDCHLRARHRDECSNPHVTAADVGNSTETQAIMRLAFAGDRHPDLRRSNAKARVQLAAAIIAMDEKEGIPGRHNLQEQAAVNVALQIYSQTLADLLRGEES